MSNSFLRVPLQKKVVDAAHEGHQGITKTKSFLRSRLWFPGMDAMVERMVREWFEIVWLVKS